MTTQYRWSGELGSCRICPKPKIHDPRHDLQYACELVNGKEMCHVSCREGFVFHDKNVESYQITCDVQTQKWSNIEPELLQCRKSIF